MMKEKENQDPEIKKLQDNLMLIRNSGGWSAEEFGNMIGVTKQTIRNLEIGKTDMSKTQYIAIRAILDYELAERPDDTVFSSTVNLCLNIDGVPDDDKKKAQAFMEGATKTGLDRETIKKGLAALIGVTAEVLFVQLASPTVINSAGTWISKIIKNKK